MPISEPTFVPVSGPAQSALRAGFRFGDKGTHSSRTLMLEELTEVLAAAPSTADRDGYSAAIIVDNCLSKPTASTRRLSNQRLGELYALDPKCAVFRVLRRLWFLEERGRPLLALLAAMSRDPLLVASAAPILALPDGTEMQRSAVRDALRKVVGERLNPAVLDKVVRNTASTWTQTGHLQGRMFKIRKRVEATPCAVAMALYLGHSVGFRGDELLRSGWVAALDCSPASAQALAIEAKRLGLIDLRTSGDVLELGLDRIDPGPARG